MENVKKVPWKHWEEWTRCWELLQESPLVALELMNVWAIREVLPVRIECTRVIFKVLKELVQSPEPKALLDLEGEVPRLAVSLVVTRCVNQIIDLSNDTKFKKSVSVTARAIKLPEFLVDLRHDATHSALPDMYLLVKGLEELLNWLFSEYWVKQYQHLIEKTENVIRDIDKFEKRARTVSEMITLAKFAEGLFKQKIECHREKIGKIIAAHRFTMHDDAWALMYLQIQAKNAKFGESVVQGVFSLVKHEKITLSQAKTSLEEIITLSPNMLLSYTPNLKHIFYLLNTEKIAFEIVQLLLKSNVLSEEIKNMVIELQGLSLVTEKNSLITEIDEIKVIRWRNLRYWTSRPIGSNSVFPEVI